MKRNKHEVVHKITHSIIAGQILLHHLEEIKHTTIYNKELKRKLNLLLPELIKNEKQYDEFFDRLEESTVVTYDAYNDFINAVGDVPIWDCQNITLIIQAYQSDPKSIEGICRKVLRDK